jgi:transposase
MIVGAVILRLQRRGLRFVTLLFCGGTGFFQEVRGCVWAGELKTTFQTAYREVEAAKKEGRFGFSEEKIRALASPFSEIAEKGLQESQPPKREPEQKGRARNSQERNLLPRLQKHKKAILRFYVDFETPFENHQAERDLRMLKVLLKGRAAFEPLKERRAVLPFVYF